MHQGYMPHDDSAPDWPAARDLVALLLVSLALAAGMAWLGALRSDAGLALEQLLPARVNTYANLLLLGSTFLYVVHLWWTNRAIGLGATWLGLVGALGLLGGAVLQAAGFYLTQPGARLPLAGMDQVMALFCAFTVLIYLAMERAYRSRAAGAFVMPIVAAAVLYAAWLAGNAPPGAGTLPILRSYVVQAHVLSNFLGYGAFAVGAALALMVLLRARAERRAGGGIALRVLPPLAHCRRWMHLAVGVGLPLFTLATLLGTRAAHSAWGRYWGWDPKECWALVVWSAYAGYFFLHYAGRWRAAALARWVLAAFALAAFGFLGAHAHSGSLHAYL